MHLLIKDSAKWLWSEGKGRSLSTVLDPRAMQHPYPTPCRMHDRRQAWLIIG